MPAEAPIFPHLNASLNLAATLFLIAGYALIRKRKFVAHGIVMGIATAISAAFLASYLTYHLNYESVKYGGEGLMRTIYSLILVPHIILAAVMTPFIFWMLGLVAARRFESHAKLARWVWPVWLYVSVTGVLVYVFLYVL
jgi:putative membrane protein